LRRRIAKPIPPKPSSISAQLAGSGTAGATILPMKPMTTCVGRVRASARPAPSNVPDAPRNRPVPDRIVNNHAVSLIPGVSLNVEPPSNVPLNESVPKSMVKVPDDGALALAGARHVSVL
jgi:hypothetical protein